MIRREDFATSWSLSGKTLSEVCASAGRSFTPCWRIRSRGGGKKPIPPSLRLAAPATRSEKRGSLGTERSCRPDSPDRRIPFVPRHFHRWPPRSGGIRIGSSVSPRSVVFFPLLRRSPYESLSKTPELMNSLYRLFCLFFWYRRDRSAVQA